MYQTDCPESQLKSWTCKWCYNHSDFELHSVVETGYLEWHLQAFTGYDPSGDQIVVSFRGSHNAENWFDDFTYFQKPYPGVEGAYVHDGFYDAYGDLYKKGVGSDYLALIKKYPGKKTLSTGHSLGAALSQIAALNFSAMGGGEIETWTYGSPRWGNQPLINYFATKIPINWRLVNLHDIVPTVPPEKGPGITSPYHHTWTEIWYTSDSPLKYKQCNGSGEDKSCDYVVPSAEDHLEYLDIHESCK